MNRKELLIYGHIVNHKCAEVVNGAILYELFFDNAGNFTSKAGALLHVWAEFGTVEEYGEDPKIWEDKNVPEFRDLIGRIETEHSDYYGSDILPEEAC